MALRWRRNRRTDTDFANEIRAHIENETDRLIHDGLSPEEARAAAQRAFGNVTRAREEFHERQRAIWLQQFLHDVRYAWRVLRQSRAFVATTVLTLAVGLGLVTVIFAIFNAYVLRPFAVHDPYSLHAVGWRAQEASGSAFRWRDYEQIAERTDLFDGVIAEATRTATLDGRNLSIGFVSGNYFEMLGARVALGRALMPADADPIGGGPVVVLTHQTWTRQFDRDPSVLGREIEVSGRKLTIVGVMAPDFVGLDDIPRDVWTPLTMHGAIAGDDVIGPAQPRSLRVIVRLRHDVTAQQAQGSVALESFETRVAGRIDAVRATLSQQATPNRVTLEGLAALSPVIAAFVLVLVAACANASNVMLARGNARHREIGIRLSIGASRNRVVRQLVTEGLLIAMLAGAAGLALAAALLRLGTYVFVVLLPPTIALRVRFVPLDFDFRVFLFALGVAAATTTFFALLPAIQATRLTLTDALRGQPSAGVKSSTLRNLLVTSQIAVSLLLLIVAATLVRNSAAIRSADLGFRPDDVISVRVRRSDSALLKRAVDALSSDARMSDVVVTSRNLLFGESRREPVRTPSGLVLAAYTFVSPGYFELLGMPILRGRGFSPDEAAQERPVAIVSQSGADALWPGEDPLGKTLRLNLEPPGPRIAVADRVWVLRRAEDDVAGGLVVTVVGVTKSIVSGFVYQGTDKLHVYLPTSASGARAESLLVRGRHSGVTAETTRTILQRAQPDPISFDVMPVEEMIALQLFPIRAASWLGSFLSAIALALSISGIYGVLTYTFGQRTQEIGVRMALGATTAAVRRLVLAQSARLAAIGTAIGLLLGFSVMKILSAFVRLANVSVIDPWAFTASVALIAAAVALAAVAPARRAARVDPSAMLRADS
ncbi:MAG TPA: ABC transporter permease [Vicinamibacterales bacterium]